MSETKVYKVGAKLDPPKKNKNKEEDNNGSKK